MVVLEETIGKLWENQKATTNISKSREIYEIVDTVILQLDEGNIRVCEKRNGNWRTNEWIKKAILLYFLTSGTRNFAVGCLSYYDKIPPKSLSQIQNNYRNVPPGVVRRGSFVSEGVIMMPAFVNIGAFVGRNTMIDTWSTIGSCAQVGSNVHISGGVGLGGVLEPTTAQPVIIEDNCFIGARSEVAEGVLIGSGSVVAMGTFVGKSTKIYSRGTGVIRYGTVPPNSVVVPGCLPKDKRYGLSCAVVVKEADDVTRSKTALNELLRD